MPAEANLHTSAVLSADQVAVWMEDQLLERSEKTLVFYPLCKKSKIPTGNGKTIDFTRYERLALPDAPIEESVTPGMTPLTLSKVQATLDEWGAWCGFSDIAGLTIKHDVMQETRDLLSDQYDETIDREIQVVLLGSSSVSYAGNVAASRGALTAADVLRSDDVRRAVATLRNNGARPAEGGDYIGIFDPSVEADVSKDPTFVQAGVYSQVTTLKNFEVGKWLGVRWQRSNQIPVLQLTSSNITQADDTGAVTGATLFAAGTTVRTKVTRLNDQTRFEDLITAETAVTNASAFSAKITIASAAATGVYKVYSTFQGGATGTATLQCRIRHTTGSNSVVYLVRLLTGTVASNVFAVTGTGPVAPATPPSGVPVHTVYITGKNAWGCVELSGRGRPNSYMTEAKADKADPLGQRRTIGWRQLFKAVVLNPNYFRRIECATEF